MSNDSGDTSARSSLAALLLAAGALVIYFLLISQWHATPVLDREDEPSEAREGAPQLELSRRLSTPTGAAETAASASTRSWLWPIAAFVPPLLIGMLWGSARVRGTDEELVFGSTHVRSPEPDTEDRTDPQHEWASTPSSAEGEARDAVAAATDPGIDASASTLIASEDDADRHENVAAADESGNTNDSDAPAEHAAVAEASDAFRDDDVDKLSDDLEALRATVRARDEVIRALEDIVKENRENWADQEGSADSQAKQIQALRAELDAANEVIELLQLADSDNSRDSTPRPQVMERG